MRYLLASTAMAALLAASTAAQSTTLYNQNNNNSGTAVPSQIYGGQYSYLDNQAADDFVVPAGTTWTVRKVRVTGQYFNGVGPATSENVYFFSDAGGMPGTLVHSCMNINGVPIGSAGSSFKIPLGSCAAALPGGANGTRYWLSVQINMPAPNGEWRWENRINVIGNAPYWQNPSGTGYGPPPCPTWTLETTCLSFANGGDHMFKLSGIP